MIGNMAIGSRNKRYFKYGIFSDWKVAIKTAKYFKQKCGSKWYIDEINQNNRKYYILYLTNAVRY